MYRRLCFVILSCFLFTMPLHAQDGIDLPADLYLLLNEGVVQRVGLGRSGIQNVTPESDFVLDFSVAPDGNWLAYRTQQGITLTNMYSNSLPQSIEDERASVPYIRGRGATMAWSPDSNNLAYTTLYGGRVWFRQGQYTDLETPNLVNLVWSIEGGYLAAEAEGDVWWIYRRDPEAMTLVSAIPSSKGITWVNNSTLAFAPPEGGLILMDMAQGNIQTPLLAPEAVYYLPNYIDGAIEVYRSTTVEEAIPTGRLLRVALDGTIEPISELDVELRALRWAPAGDWLIAFQGSVLALVNPLNGQGFTLPFGGISTYDWGIIPAPDTDTFTLPAPATFTAISNVTGVVQVWRMRSGELPATITPAVVDISEYTISFNGERVAYVSNSSLWLHTIGSSAPPLELVRLGTDRDINPAFSADGLSIYYRDEQENGSGIWHLDISTIEMPTPAPPTPTTEPATATITPEPDSEATDVPEAEGTTGPILTPFIVPTVAFASTLPATLVATPTPDATSEAEEADALPTALPTNTPSAELDNTPLATPDYAPELVLADTEAAAYLKAVPAGGVAALLVSSISDGQSFYELYDPTSGTLQRIGSFTEAHWLRGTNLIVRGRLGETALPGLHIIDVNTLTTPPRTRLSLLEGWDVLDMIERSDGGLRVLIRQQTPGTVAVMDVPPEDGAQITVEDIGYITEPRLSPDGSIVIGLTHPGGMLVRIDLRNMSRSQLRGIEGSNDFRWG
ncbi:PD40 domain-containing protein [Phototrophicus methaneseepsis]|uniref:PD40 domain-containing protein n=1 Tax=Phototrophicus methaneseepsis TaxID=2710758 RepID=A0A7S8E8I4_9CHLR|nr:PD40 domain-containing protein [Phototrophicus methaneseepsis]QPC82353.1 PD40 domain-containing protein [Phototrophicus methaneseepsis]